MPSLSVIMIVKNEAQWLGACLESVSSIADEIVVGDTGSTDTTVALAEAGGARVIHVPWTDDFAAARNATIEAARGDWLLHMDADEMLDPRGAAAIRAIVDSDEESDAVELVLANYSNDMHAWRWTPVDPSDPMTRGYGGCLPVGLLRLFRANRGFVYREAVHENITASVMERGGRIRRTDIVIHHYGYDVAPEIRKRKARQYLDLARKKCREHPGSLKCLHDLAEQAMACGETEEAEGACREALALNDGHVETATTLATILLGRDAVDEAEALLKSLEVRGALPAHIQIVLGVIAGYRGEWEAATERLQRVIDQGPPAPLATLCLARIYDYRGEGDTACELLRALAEAAPRLDEVRMRLESHGLRRLGEAKFVAGDLEGGLTHLVKSLELDPEDGLTHNDIGVVLHALGETARAREAFERALALAPALLDARENLAQLSATSS